MIKSKRLTWLTVMIGLVVVTACGGPSRYQKMEQAEATKSVGEAYMRQGNFTAALAELLKAQKLNPDDPYLYNDLGLCYMAKKHYDLSIRNFKKAIELKPDYAPARNNLGTAYLATQDWDAAIAAFNEITKDVLYATPHYPLTNLGLAYFHKGDYKTAERYFLKALKLQPNFVLALRNLGRTYLADGKIDQAITLFQQAVAQSPDNAMLRMDLGNAFRAIGDNQNALQAYRMVMQLAPNTPLAEEAQKAVAAVGP